MNKRKVSYEKTIFSIEIMIENTLSDPEMLAAAATLGYSREKIGEGKALFQKCRELSMRVSGAQAEKLEATVLAAEARKNAHAAYARTLKVARIAFAGNIKAEKALQLDGRRKRDFSGWTEQAGTFYGNLQGNKDLSAVMASYGWTAERLSSELTLVREAERRNNDRNSAAGDARKAVETRDDCFNELAVWVSAFRKIMRIALSETPQALEKLGIVVPSRRK